MPTTSSRLQPRRLPPAVGPAHQPARPATTWRSRRVVGYHQIATLPVVGRGDLRRRLARGRQHLATARRRHLEQPAHRGQRLPRRDTWLGPFYVALRPRERRRASFYLFLGRDLTPNANVAGAQPRGGLASVHADEGARDAAARADRARRRRVARTTSTAGATSTP